MLSFESGLAAFRGGSLRVGTGTGNISKLAMGRGRPAKGLSLACWGLCVFSEAPAGGQGVCCACLVRVLMLPKHKTRCT